MEIAKLVTFKKQKRNKEQYKISKQNKRGAALICIIYTLESFTELRSNCLSSKSVNSLNL